LESLAVASHPLQSISDLRFDQLRTALARRRLKFCFDAF
jgi:hypothetical protein